MLVGSLLVLGLVCLCAWVIVRLAGRRWWPGLSGLTGGSGAARGLVRVVARQPLEPRRSLYVVAVAGKVLLLGSSEAGLTVLAELDPESVDDEPVATRWFGAAM